MIKPEEILVIARDTINQFPYGIKKPLVQILPRKTFSKFLNDSGMKKHLKYTPAFVAHLPERDCICYCPDIVNGLMKNKQKEKYFLFVQAVTLHELFHIKNAENGVCACSSVDSEKLVDSELKAEFPKHAELLESISPSNSGKK